MKPDVLVVYPTLPRQMAALEAAYTLHRLDLATDPAGVIAAATPTCEAVVTNGHAGLDRALIEALPKLKIVACSSAGYETVDVAALNERGIRLTNTSDALYDDVADTALMLMLAARRGLVRGDRHVRTGDWGRSGPLPLMSSTRGKRLGIVGLGRIGRAIALRGAALGLEIGYSGRSRKPDSDYAYFPTPLALAEWADIVIAATAGGAGTRSLISAGVIDAIGPQGTFVNIARGTVVDEPALIAALREGRLGSAGLDVYLNEPNPDPAFATLDNVVLYPHHASGTTETRDAMAQLVVDNLAAHFAGLPLLTPVN